MFEMVILADRCSGGKMYGHCGLWEFRPPPAVPASSRERENANRDNTASLIDRQTLHQPITT